MKREELAEELGVSASYLYGHWNEVVERYDRIGISLRRRGRGVSADYGIKRFNDKDVIWKREEL